MTAAAAISPAGAPKPEKNDLRIEVNTIDLQEITWKALKGLQEWNADAPSVFIRAGKLVRVGEDEDGRPAIDDLDEYGVRYELARAIDWVRTKTIQSKDGSKYLETIVPPPMDVVRDFMRSPVIEFGLPPLRGVIECPTMKPDGSILDRRGYDLATGLYYAPAPTLSIPRLPEEPTPGQVRAAVELLDEVICDFPFVDQASRANLIATMITPIIRPMIAGPVPLALIDKPAAGTGASLLAEVIAEVVQGRDAAMLPAPEDEAEWKKRVLSQLISGRSICILDNVEGALRSSALALVLTASTYEDRILGRSKMVVLPHRCCWIATGINIDLGGDIPRRCYWIRLDANSARPWQRNTAFVHPDLKCWVRDVRGAIIAAILILARAWTLAGRPIPPNLPKVGGFESWTETIGGILHHAGIAGFLANLDQMYDEVDSDGPEWAAFFGMWWDLWRDEPKTVSSIVQYIRDQAGTVDLNDQLLSVVPPEVMESWSKNGSSFANKLGHALRRRAGKVYPNGFRLLKAAKAHNTATWSLQRVPE